MTFRAVLLGLGFAAFICGVTFFNDFVLRQTFLVGNYMPISVFGGLLLLVMLVNPLLRLFSKRAILSGRELAVIVALALVACAVPGRGLMHYFTTFLMIPHEEARINVAWKSRDVLSVPPQQMLADVSRNRAEAVRAFAGGIGDGRRHIAFSQIPWRVWTRALVFWVPLILSVWLAVIALAVVVHRQWSDHEKLRYPIATFAHALLPEPGKAGSSVFRNRLFWIPGFGVILIHLNNYAYLYNQDHMFQIPLAFDFMAVGELFPTFVRGGGHGLLYVRVYLMAVGFAYFLASDLSLALGIAPFVYAWASGICLVYGFTLTGGGWFTPMPRTFLHGGAYFAMFLVLMYSGRRYFSAVFRRSLMLGGKEKAEGASVWAARLFLLGLAAFIAQLYAAGVDLPFAILYAIGIVAIYTVISRLVAETGVFFIHAYFFPCVIMFGFLGGAVMGTRALMIMFLVSSLLVIDPREAVMPFMVTGLKLVDLTGGKVGKTAGFAAVALLVAFAVAIPVTLYIQYDRGAKNVGDGWTLRAVPMSAFNAMATLKTKLEQEGTLAEAQAASPWARFAKASPYTSCVWAFFISMALVLGFSAGRMRFPWWPLHPIIFLVLGTYQSQTLSRSFLIGWFIKIVVSGYFGGRTYQKVKPFMIGLIAGDVIGGILPMVHGWIYEFTTGQSPMRYLVLPL